MTAEVQELSAAPTAPRLYWWKETLLIGLFYGLYTLSRDGFGSARLSATQAPLQAFHNARHIIGIERALGLFHEAGLQHAFLSARWFIWLWNVFYGTAHFVVTVGVFVWMYHRGRHLFTRWRNCILAATAVALIGFSFFPVMPPRLLDSTTRYGGATLEAQAHLAPSGIHDTLQDVGGLWSFDSGAMTRLSNQYAAMPSLHCAWATWCAIVGWQLTRRRWARALLVLYPFCTLFCIIVTGNHYWLDGIGGLCTLALGFVIGGRVDAWNNRRLSRAQGATG
jgi:membrane-associated phospholipid phosphatase